MKYFISIALLSLSLQAQTYINWQPPVVKETKGSHQGHSGHGGRKAKQLQVNNCDHNAKSEAYYLMPTLEKKPLTPAHGLVSLPRTGMDNYHALVINQTSDKTVNSSVRYIYSYGKPSKTSPTKITQFQKSDLEIEPILLPREHDEYKGSNSYDFLVRFKGKVLPKHEINFTTSNGTKESLNSDEDGEFSITMPNDFSDVKMGRRKNKPAEFVLLASYTYQDKTYTTTLAMPYHVNSVDYWNSREAGTVVLILGLILGLYLFRNINKKKKKQRKA